MLSQNSNLKSQTYNANLKSNDVKARAYHFSLEIIKFVNALPNKRAFWSIGDQVLRSTTSIGANMIEGKASSSKREFIKFYEIALKSANETKYWICLLRDSYPDLKEECSDLLKEAMEISNMLGSSVLTLKGKKKF
ncbi:MAG: four helix bundle protein [Candidatus Spechtbacteria bacterium]|nr:four helix bundle protein [Candidatus Spechtbacteria bacterium]